MTSVDRCTDEAPLLEAGARAAACRLVDEERR
jgi:hypothetical protein